MVIAEPGTVLRIPVDRSLASDRPANELEAVMRASASVHTRQLKALASLRVFFGHQSVGNNILAGLQSLATETGVEVGITTLSGPTGPGTGIFHFPVGRNGDPLLKMQDFARRIASLSVRRGDVLMMKLCYADIDADTDPVELADRYVSMIGLMREQHPGARVVAMTVPLTTVQAGPKAAVKRLLGRAPAGAIENAKRREFNVEVRDRLGGPDLFDLAAVEACPGHPGRSFSYQGLVIEALATDLTDDGGHLNAAGARLVAVALVDFLALSARPSP